MLAVLVCIAVAILALNSLASRSVVLDELSSRSQHFAQLLLVWFIPIIGALLVLQMYRRDLERPSGRYPDEKRVMHDLYVPLDSLQDHARSEETHSSHGGDAGGGAF
jgi:hypothetical protein